MRRVAYERHDVEGFKLAKFESMASASSGQRIYLSTSDGNLSAYEMKFPSLASKSFGCNNVENIVAKKSREKHTVSSLIVAESWRVLVAIYDGAVAAFDLQPFRLPQEQPISILPETKGCSAIAIHERSSLLVVVSKKKLSFYFWQGSSFALRKELMLSDAPKAVYCLSHTVIIGQKRHYETVDVTTLEMSRLLDVERDQKMVCVELPESIFRPHTVMLSSGLQGLLFDVYMTSGVSDTARAYLTWSASPTTVCVADPYIISQLSDSSVEVHDGATLLPVQRIVLSGIAVGLTCYNVGSTAAGDASLGGGSGMGANGAVGRTSGAGFGKSSSGVSEQLILVGAGENLHLLKMAPIGLQIAELVASALYEDALNLCLLYPNKAALSQITPSVSTIHELHAAELLHRGEYSSAMSHYISAGSPPAAVLSLFPDFIASSLRPAVQQLTARATGGREAHNTSPDGAGPLPNIIALEIPAADFAKAAAAVAQFCSHHRNLTKHAADKAEAARNALRISTQKLTSTRPNFGSGNVVSASALGSSSEGQSQSKNPFGEDDDIEAAEDAIRLAELVDTVMLHAFVQCSPPRKSSVIDLLSTANRCHLDSSSMMLASQGRAFTEALLWLYRSRGDHKKVLSALTEDKCVGAGGWSRDQFYRWTAEYLRWLWFSDDAALPSLALIALKTVVEYDAELGLSILTVRPRGKVKTSFGGKGVSVQDVLNYLESCTPPPPAQSPFLSPLPPPPPVQLTSGTMTSSIAAAPMNTSVSSSAIAPPAISSSVSGSAALPKLTSLLTALPVVPSLISTTLSSSAAPAPAPSDPDRSLSLDADTGFQISRVCAILGDELAAAKEKLRTAGNTVQTPLLSKCEPIPLINGRSLGLAYLEWLVEGGAASPDMHDEYAQLLMEGIPFESDMNHSADDLVLREGDSESVQLYKIYRHKLQTFLQISSEYNAERLLRFLPPQFLHEYALLLSRLGRHEEVLRIYVHQLRNYQLAESYCGRIYGSLTSGLHSSSSSPSSSSSGAGAPQPSMSGPSAAKAILTQFAPSSALYSSTAQTDAKNIYLLLIKVILSAPATATSAAPATQPSATSDRQKQLTSAGKAIDRTTGTSAGNISSEDNSAYSNANNLDLVLTLAERYYDRVDSLALLALLPEDMPLVKLQRYLSIVMEEMTFKKRNLQVIHQLLRVREVDLRTAPMESFGY